MNVRAVTAVLRMSLGFHVCVTLFMCSFGVNNARLKQFTFLDKSTEYFMLFLGGGAGGWFAGLFSLGAQDRIEVHEMN